MGAVLSYQMSDVEAEHEIAANECGEPTFVQLAETCIELAKKDNVREIIEAMNDHVPVTPKTEEAEKNALVYILMHVTPIDAKHVWEMLQSHISVAGAESVTGPYGQSPLHTMYAWSACQKSSPDAMHELLRGLHAAGLHSLAVDSQGFTVYAKLMAKYLHGIKDQLVDLGLNLSKPVGNAMCAIYRVTAAYKKNDPDLKGALADARSSIVNKQYPDSWANDEELCDLVVSILRKSRPTYELPKFYTEKKNPARLNPRDKSYNPTWLVWYVARTWGDAVIERAEKTKQKTRSKRAAVSSSSSSSADDQKEEKEAPIVPCVVSLWARELSRLGIAHEIERDASEKLDAFLEAIKCGHYEAAQWILDTRVHIPMKLEHVQRILQTANSSWFMEDVTRLAGQKVMSDPKVYNTILNDVPTSDDRLKWMIKACISGAPLPIETVAAMLRSDIAPSDLDACLINADIEDRHLLAHHVADFMDPADGDSRWWEVLFSLVEQGVRFDARDVLRRAFKGKKRNKPKHDQIRTLMGLLNCRQEDMMIIELDGEAVTLLSREKKKKQQVMLMLLKKRMAMTILLLLKKTMTTLLLPKKKTKMAMVLLPKKKTKMAMVLLTKKTKMAMTLFKKQRMTMLLLLMILLLLMLLLLSMMMMVMI
jgi:hypothetical protein